MEIIDKLVQWSVALSPVVGGVWIYFASRSRKQIKLDEAPKPAGLTIMQGQSVQIDHTTDFIDFLKTDHAEMNRELIETKQRLKLAHEALNRANIQIP